MAETFQLYIDGAFCNAGGSATFESLDPSTGKTWALMPKASAVDTDRAVRAVQGRPGLTVGLEHVLDLA